MFGIGVRAVWWGESVCLSSSSAGLLGPYLGFTAEQSLSGPGLQGSSKEAASSEVHVLEK